MRKFLLIVLIILNGFINILYAQNLVPNPSFEDTISCPYGLNRLYFCQGWHPCRGTPDYFNSCSNTGTNVPNSGFGFQYAHTGNGMIGVLTYRNPTLPDGPNYREYAICELDSEMVIGKQYFFSFFTNYSHNNPFQAVASNNIGMKFSTVKFDSIYLAPLTNSATVWSSQIITDSINWIKFSGSFFADSAYKFLLLGNFFNDNLTDTISFTSIPEGSYYYIDDICVSSDSVYNNSWTEIFEVLSNQPQLLIFPNPSTGQFTLKCSEEINYVEIFNSLGKLITTIYPYSNVYEFNHFLTEGIYFLSIGGKFSTINTKIIITSKN